MKKIVVIIVTLAATVHSAYAKFSADTCGEISQCCSQYDGGDDSDEMESVCCGSYNGTEFYNCWEVCIRGESAQYCNFPACSPGYGYNEQKKTCEPCSDAYYSVLDTWTGQSGDNITDYRCTQCPSYTTNNTTVSANSAQKSTSKTNCYISKSKTWAFSDSSGSGETSFTADCYYK